MKLSATLSAAEPFINKAKFGLAAFGATSHIAAATASGSGLSARDIPMLSIHKDLVVNIASTYSKYLSPIPLALNAIKKLAEPENFWRGIAELSPMMKILAGHVSNLPFFTGLLAAYNSLDKQTREFFQENPDVEEHKTQSQNRMDHLSSIFKNMKTMMKHSLKEIQSGKDKFKHFSRLTVVPGFSLPFFYGMVFGRGEKLNLFTHKLIRWARSVVGMVADADKVINGKDKFIKKMGAAFFLDSLVNSFSPWLEGNDDARNLTGNLSATISETGNLLYSMYLQGQKYKAAKLS
ncbi:MAG: hypothetical protein VKK32_08020 [Candidatus Melainabacteria bacterium]|nr:hypothetical protein [Candidatus Melainabacteria bacterium]